MKERRGKVKFRVVLCRTDARGPAVNKKDVGILLVLTPSSALAAIYRDKQLQLAHVRDDMQ